MKPSGIYEYLFGIKLEPHGSPNLFIRDFPLIHKVKNSFLLGKSDPKFIYFMDDDLLDWRALFCIPAPYALRLLIKTTAKRKIILSSCAEFWVSTPYLAEKYSAWSPRLIRPIASGPLLERTWKRDSHPTSSISGNLVRICYHGTWSHREDMKWLAPIIMEVQKHCPNSVFEVIGGERVANIFKGVPRVEVMPNFSWEAYLKHTQMVRQDIGLAPLQDTPFNRGRGPIKFFDYSRAGAVGVYSSGPAFSKFISHGIDGFVLTNDPQLWINTIVHLVNSPQLRQRMAESAWLKVLDNSPLSVSTQQYLKDLNQSLIRLSNHAES